MLDARYLTNHNFFWFSNTLNGGIVNDRAGLWLHKRAGGGGQWFFPVHAVRSKIGKMPIEQVNQHDIKTCISPIWHGKGETAKKAMHRVNIVIKHAAAMGLDVDIGAVEKSKALLGQSKQQKQSLTCNLAWTQIQGSNPKLLSSWLNGFR